MQKIEAHILRLQTTEGFINLFFLMCQEYPTQEKAYDACERQYSSYFGKPKYSSFESFRQIKNRHFKNKK